MKTGRRVMCWLTVFGAVVTFTVVSMRALDNHVWTTADALGDVAVSFNGAVRLFENDGSAIGDLAFTSTATGGLVFDNALNLLVANTSGNEIVKYSPNPGQPPNAGTHTPTTIPSQAPRSLVVAGDGTIYVASVGSPATIRRIPATGICPTGGCPEFTVPTDSTTCISIDLAPDQSTLYYVSGQRNVRRVANANSVTGSATATTLSPNLPGPGTACGIRLLPPVDARSTSPRVASSIVGGMLIADAREIKRLDSSNNVVQTYNAGTENDSQKTWVDIALDPNTWDFWAVEATFSRLARFRLTGGNQLLVPLTAAPRGVALNGELRAAQTIRLLNLSSNCTSTSSPACWVESAVAPAFLAGTPYVQEFRIRPEPVNGTSAAAFVAIQAVEARSNGVVAQQTFDDGVCQAAQGAALDELLDLDCRIAEHFPATPATKATPLRSLGRSVFYIVTELQATPLSEDVPLQIFVVSEAAVPTAGGACTSPTSPTQPAGAVLRDPYPHTALDPDTELPLVGYSPFEEDITFLVYSDERGIGGKTLNHYVVADRSNTLYTALMVKPMANASQNIGSTLQVAVEIRNPKTACSPVPNLNGVLALSVTDLAKKKLIVDTEGVSSGPQISGLTFVSTASQYRANITVASPTFTVGNTVRVCVNAKADVDNPTAPRAIGEICRNVLITGSPKK